MQGNRWTRRLATGALALAVVVSPGMIAGTAQQASAEAANKAYESIFEQNKVIDVKVTISDEDWKSILASPLDKAYKSVTVDVDGHTLSNVGFSTKGNMTLKSVASMTDSDRYSFRLKFDKYDKSQTLLGLDKMALNNNYTDPSYMREYLHYEALRSIGLDAPLVTYVNLYINGELFGFYTGIEEVDDSYLARNFGDDYKSGTLYDTEEGAYLQYKEGSEYDELTYEVGTDDGKASLKSFIKTLNEMPDGEKGVIESVLDVNSALKYIAANAVLGSYDSYNGDKGHNYLLYGNSTGKFTVIPWDFNMSFNGYASMGGGGRGPGGAAGASGTAGDTSASTADGASGATAASSVTNTSAVTASVDNPTLGIDISKVPMINNLLKVPEYKTRYLSYVTELTNYLKGIQTRITDLAAWIRPYVAADPTKFYTIDQFDANVTYSATEDANVGGMGGTPPEGWTPPDGTMPTGAPPSGTAPTGTPPDGAAAGAGQPAMPGNMGGGFGGGMGSMAAGSIMTFALNRLVNLEQQLGLEVTTLPETIASSGTGSASSGASGSGTAAGGTSTGIKVMLNGSTVSFADQQPILSGGRVLVPMASIFSAYGAKVSYENKTKTITAVKDSKTIKLTIGSAKAYVNGSLITLDVPATIAAGRTMVPVRFISESLGLDVNWDKTSRTVTIASK